MDFCLTRAHALQALSDTLPLLGRRYADSRNTDNGTGGRPTTSRLSPYLRRRLLLESEVVAAARAEHGEAAEKFVQEVFWRSYFKGHLETRPWLWANYLAALHHQRGRLAASSGLNTAHDAAIGGRTGIDCFDDWARALVAENWLHNHTRMWFASIWIFTLRLPWELGADFFARHLIDFDPASNTLSWRWVAGLHTRGKHYAARAENIRRFTAGRYEARGLNETSEPLEEPEGASAAKLPQPEPAPATDVALLLHLDDLNPETLDLGPARIARVYPQIRHIDGAANAIKAADLTAMHDALARAAAHFGCDIHPDAGGLPVLTAWAPVGPSADDLPGAIKVRRAWDSLVWPRSTRGFFKVKEAIPEVLAQLG